MPILCCVNYTYSVSTTVGSSNFPEVVGCQFSETHLFTVLHVSLSSVLAFICPVKSLSYIKALQFQWNTIENTEIEKTRNLKSLLTK